LRICFDKGRGVNRSVEKNQKRIGQTGAQVTERRSLEKREWTVTERLVRGQNIHCHWKMEDYW
jgi:hypothetical protein